MAQIDLKQSEVVIEFGLLVKLGSIVVHADEAISADGHAFDIAAMKPLIESPEVQKWIKEMGVYLPLKRKR